MKTIEKKRSTPLYLIVYILISILLFDFLYLSLTLLEEFVINLDELTVLGVSYSAVFHIVLLLFQLFLIVSLFVKWYSTYYVIASNSLTKKSGILLVKKRICNYSNVSSVQFKQGVLSQLFDCGDVYFDLANGSTRFVIKGVESPASLVERIEQLRSISNNA